jgi:PAS domain S-box-containing protein
MTSPSNWPKTAQTGAAECQVPNEAFRASEEMLRSITQNVPGMIFQFYARRNGDLGFNYVSDHPLVRLGFDTCSLVGVFDRFVAAVAPEDRERFLASIRAAVDSVSQWRFEGKFRQPNGEEMFFLGSAQPRLVCDELVFDGLILDITERKRSEGALRESERNYRDVFNGTSDAMLIFDPANERLVDVNEAMLRMYGYEDKEEALRARLEDLVAGEPPHTADSARERWSRPSAVGLQNFEGLGRKKNGETFWVDVTLRVSSVGGRQRISAVVRDITERKRAKEALERRIIALTRPLDAPEGIAFEDLFNLPDIQHLQDLFAEACAVASIITRPDGTPITRPSNFCSLCSDIIRKTEKGLKNCYCSDAILGRYNPDGPTIQPCLSGGLWDAGASITVGGRHIANWLIGQVRNEAQDEERMMGYAREIGADEQAFRQAFRRVPMMQLDQFERIARALFAVANQLSTTAYQNIQQARFITERKEAEERISEQAALLDAANDAIYVRAMDHTVTYWNDGAERLFEWTRAEALGRKITDWGDLGGEAFESAHAALLKEGSWSGELTRINKAGKKVTVFCRWTLLRDDQGKPKAVLAINTDITEQKRLETSYLRAQRMEGVGALAGGIAHDLNNILQPILMTVPLLSTTTNDPESREMLNTVESCAQRGADIIRQLLTFARGTPGVRVPLPVYHLIRDVDKIIRETFPRNIQVSICAPHDLWSVIGDATQIHQALMNLCVNSRDAMPDGGRLTLAAENLTLDEAFAATLSDAKPGPHVRMTVTDTGTGIPPEHLEHIFDPFFSTKEIGKGTGLGLPTVLGIVRGHGGCLRIKSQIGKGTIFELYLPASPDAKAATPTQKETLPPRGSGELILVVDDEPSVRRMIQRMLETHGYRVVTAAEGAEAISLFAQYRSEVRVVLTDMMMPGVDGPSLVRALRLQDPQLPILGMTGVSEKADVKGLAALDLAKLLTKPFTNAALLEVLPQTLAKPHLPSEGTRSWDV